MLHTKIDQFITLIRGDKRTVDVLIRELRMKPQALDALAALMESAGVVQVDYPLNVMEKPQVNFVQLPPEPKRPAGAEDVSPGRLIETYTFKADDVPATVEIRDTGRERFYNVSLVELSVPTRIFLDQIKEQLIKSVPAENSDVSDIERVRSCIR